MFLSDIKIQKAKPREKPYKLKDGDGLWLLIHPNGGRYWRLRYHFAGKEKTLALGTYPEVSLADARDKRAAARKLVANGTDPGAKKKDDKRLEAFKANNTFEAVAKDWFETNKSKWSSDHAERLWRRLELYAFKDIGNRPITELKTPDLIPVLRKQEKFGILDTARRLAQVLNVVFRYLDALSLKGGITHIMGIFAEAFSLFAPTRKLQIENKEELATEICRRLATA